MATVEACANCGRSIGRLELPHVWQNHIVCAECNQRLRSAVPAAREPAAAVPIPPLLLPQRRERSVFVPVVLGVVVGGIVLAGIAIAIAVATAAKQMDTRRAAANEMLCAANLRQIGQAILLYSNENRGKFPPSFAELIKTQDVVSTTFVCPVSKDQPATGQGDAQAAELVSGGHCSFMYLGSGLTSSAGADTLVAYEWMSNHGGQAHALFGDGHVELMSDNALNVEIQRATARGQRLSPAGQTQERGGKAP